MDLFISIDFTKNELILLIQSFLIILPKLAFQIS